MTINLFMNILATVAALTGSLLLAHKNRLGFLVFFLDDFALGFLGAQTSQWGVTVTATIFALTNAYAYYKWRKTDVARTNRG